MPATVCRMGQPIEPPKPTEPRTYWRVVVIIALVLLAVGFVINRVANRDDLDGYDARVACQTFVEDRLNERPVLPERGHASATASFSNMQHSGTGPMWTVTGTAQAGATFRRNFTCQVRLDGDVFRLVSLTGLSN